MSFERGVPTLTGSALPVDPEEHVLRQQEKIPGILASMVSAVRPR